MVYPDSLPMFSEEGYGYEDTDTINRTDMEAGHARHRQMVRQPEAHFNVQAIYTASQMALFEGWYAHIISSGVDWFDIQLDVGRGVITHTARFVKKYTVNRWGRYRRVSATLEVVDRAILTESEWSEELEA